MIDDMRKTTRPVSTESKKPQQQTKSPTRFGAKK